MKPLLILFKKEHEKSSILNYDCKILGIGCFKTVCVYNIKIRVLEL